MSQRVMSLDDGTQIISGTGIMRGHDDGRHTREMDVTMPPFGSAPDITLTIYSDFDREPDPDPDTGNRGQTFAPWSIQYLALDGGGPDDRLVICATNTAPAIASNARVFCSYLVIGEAA